MSREYDGGWTPYVPVAERRRKAAREMEKLRKKGHPVAPVIIEGRTIARTFWGKAWCENLESYRDYENRLPRGRTYVRNGAVVDLQISALEIRAIVSGSSLYKVTVTIKALAPTAWRSICEDCAGGITSLVELLQGRFSKGVMERICRQDKGLFPRPSDIRFSCTCPDWASMCKHVAATLYGVGTRLDETPELLFRLRAVDEKDLLADLDKALPFSDRALDVGRVLETDDVSALFGLDIAGSGDAIGSNGGAPAVPEVVDRSRRKGTAPRAAGRAPVVRPRPVTGSRREDGGSVQQPVAPTPPKAQQAPKAQRAGRGSKATNRSGAAAPLSPPGDQAIRTRSKGQKSTGRRRTPKPEIELTPDGFVKWWK